MKNFFIYCEDIDLALATGTWPLGNAGTKLQGLPPMHRAAARRARHQPWQRRNYLVTGFRNRLQAMFNYFHWRGRAVLDRTADVAGGRHALASVRGRLASTVIMALAISEGLGDDHHFAGTAP